VYRPRRPDDGEGAERQGPSHHHVGGSVADVGLERDCTTHVTTCLDRDTNQRYLVYGSFNFGPIRNVVTPTVLLPIGDAERDLSFLTDPAVLSATTGRISGAVNEGNQFSTKDRRPLPGIRLRVRVGDFVAETVTDALGRFDVAGVPEGFFTIEPELPQQLTSANWGNGKVLAGGCVSKGVLVQWNGIIRGRILLSDLRARSGAVDLLPADNRNPAFERNGRTVMANANGAYEFNAVPPGEYFIGINLRRAPSPGMPYPPAYFPGTVRVGEGTVQNEIDFVLASSLRIGRLEVRPSTPSAGVVSACVRSVVGAGGGTYPQRARGEPAVVDVVEGVRYRVWLHVVEKSGRHLESDPIDVTGDAGLNQLTLSVNKPAGGVDCGFPP
jgi:hypothetical protein